MCCDYLILKLISKWITLQVHFRLTDSLLESVREVQSTPSFVRYIDEHLFSEIALKIITCDYVQIHQLIYRDIKYLTIIIIEHTYRSSLLAGILLPQSLVNSVNLHEAYANQ